MAPLVFADHFLAGSILTLVLPLGLLIALAVWYLIGLGHIPEPDPDATLVGEPVPTNLEPRPPDAAPPKAP